MRGATLYVPFSSGLNGKVDARALLPPSLNLAKDVEFDEIGGLQTRHPYSSLGTSILGGGSISTSDFRRVVANGDELLLFTRTALYSWSDRDSKWVSKGTYLAPKVTERSVFVRPAEQKDAARAELSGAVVFAWTEALAGTTHTYVAAYDKVTGAVLLAPFDIGVDTTRPRLIALSTKIILTYVFSNTLLAKALDPASLATSVATAGIDVINADASFQDVYDAVKIGGNVALVYRRTPSTSYGLSTFGENLIETQTTKARQCGTHLAISAAPNGTHVQILRENGANIEGDYIQVSGWTDVFTAQAVGTFSGTLNQLTGAHRSVQDSGQNRCYAFWSSGETAASTNFNLKYNWVDTGNTLGTEATFVKRLGVASRAFDHDGSVYLWAAFAGESATGGMAEPLGFRAQLQNTYFLYRDDVSLVAKAAPGKAGGFAVTSGHVTGVQDLGSGLYAWAGLERRIIPLGGDHSGYSDRGPRDVQVQFDSNDARRAVRLGATLYVTGGQLLQYDGQGLVEVGFHIYPWYFATVDGGAGGKDAGNFTYKYGWRWDNNQGERERSTTASYGQSGTLAASHKVAMGSTVPLHTTLKQGSRIAPAAECWATLKDPVVDSPFYLVTSQDPNSTSNPNRYLANDPAASFLPTLDDSMADSAVATKETHPENGDVLESLAPPPCSVVAATQDRLFLAGISDNPHQVWYSRLRDTGEIASFHDALTFEVPPAGGVITALAFLNETLIVFKEAAVYALPGDGFDNTGGGANYGPARLLSSDVGAKRAEAVALVPQGLLFHSKKGWYLLDRGWQMQYAGGPVVDFDDEVYAACHAIESKHQVRCVGDDRIVVWDYLAGQWAEWTPTGGAGATVWRGTYVRLATGTSAGVYTERADYASGVDYGLDVETAWIKVGGPVDQGRLHWLNVLGEVRPGVGNLRVRVAYNYDDTYVDDKYWAVSPTTAGKPLQVRHGFARHKVEAVKVRLTAYASGSTTNPPTDEALKLTGLALEGHPKRGIFKGLPSAQKQ